MVLHIFNRYFRQHDVPSERKVREELCFRKFVVNLNTI